MGAILSCWCADFNNRVLLENPKEKSVFSLTRFSDITQYEGDRSRRVPLRPVSRLPVAQVLGRVVTLSNE